MPLSRISGVLYRRVANRTFVHFVLARAARMSYCERTFYMRCLAWLSVSVLAVQRLPN